MLDRPTLRLHAVSLAVASWLVLAWTQAVAGQFDRFGTLRGVDFLQFYAAGWFVAHGHVDRLYDWDAFARTLPRVVSGIGDLLFLPVYPPQVAYLFAPLAHLPYLQALAIWTAISAALYVAAVQVVVRALPALSSYRVESWGFALGFPPFLLLIAHGQVASLAVPLLVASLLALEAGRPLLVGLALGSLAFKPQLGTFAIAALVLTPSWRLMAGLLIGLGLHVGLAASMRGGTLLLGYIEVGQRLLTSAGEFEPKVWAMHSLRGALELLLGHGRLATACWLLAGVGVLWLARHAWSRHRSSEVRFALIAITGLLLNPHLYVYDLVLLAVPLACLAAWLVERCNPIDASVQYLAYSLVWLPLLAPLAAFTHVQLTAPALVALLWCLGRYRVATTQNSSA